MIITLRAQTVVSFIVPMGNIPIVCQYTVLFKHNGIGHHPNTMYLCYGSGWLLSSLYASEYVPEISITFNWNWKAIFLIIQVILFQGG